jgi:hypothetical protein
VQQFIAVGRLQDILKRVARMKTCMARSGHQQVQVVVAEYANGAVAKLLYEPQCLQRLRAAIYQIADKPERIVRGIEVREIEQPPQRIVTALHIADCVGGHGCGFCVKQKRRGVPRLFLRGIARSFRL